jgi:dethiobiotin synthetase
MRRDFFVTGTDTGVGKTLVSTAMLCAWRHRGRTVAGMKPVASGSSATPQGLRNDDALKLLREGSRAWPYGVINPYAFEPPIAPQLAAEEAGIEIDIATILQQFRLLQAASGVVVVEGAGGFLVPLSPRLSTADLPAALGLEVILVVGLRLGCLNHGLLTAEAIARRGLRLAGWVGSALDPGFARPEANVASLRRSIDAPCLGIVPHLGRPDAARAAESLPGLSSLDPGAAD